MCKCWSFGFSVNVLELHGLVVFVASLGDFQITSCGSGWICFHWTGGFITCAKPCKRQFRCDRNAVKDEYRWSCCMAKRVSRENNVQECVFDHEHVIHWDAVLGGLINIHTFSQPGCTTPLNIAPWVHVGSVSLNFKVTTSACADQWNLAGSKEQTEEILSHEMKTHWHLQVP